VVTKELGPIHSNFLMVPSGGATMLIKSIAVRDIMLPHTSCTDQVVGDETKTNVWQQLDEVSTNYFDNVIKSQIP